MRRIFQRIFDLVYPKNAVCMGCGDGAGFEGEWLCPRCRQTLAKKWKGAFYDPLLDGSAAAFYYSGPAGFVVRNMKYRGVWAMKDMMVREMLRAFERIQPAGVELVVAVPMHPRRLKKRGFNQSEVLAREIAAQLALPFGKGLIRTRNTVQQARLEGKARRDNLKNAFEADESVAGRWVLLVDDVYTTGTTAHECAKALRKAGAKHVSFLAYAIGEQKQ